MGRRRTLDVDETLSQETPEVQEDQTLWRSD